MIGRIIRLGLIVGVIVLAAVALFRPATLFGIDAKNLGNSVGGEIHQSDALCIEESADHWRCALQGNTVEGVEYAVTTKDYGCWDATRVVQPASASPGEQTVSGCVGLTDMIGG